jgi:hypothetical protein
VLRKLGNGTKNNPECGGLSERKSVKSLNQEMIWGNPDLSNKRRLPFRGLWMHYGATYRKMIVAY